MKIRKTDLLPGFNRNVLAAYRQAHSMPDQHQPDNDRDEYQDWERCRRCNDVTRHLFKRNGPMTFEEITLSDGRKKTLRVTCFTYRCLECRPFDTKNMPPEEAEPADD